jgi:broad specificity phosphatase PhoE
MMTVKHFYIFRHGECPLNKSGYIQGQHFNGNLTEQGKLQAQQTAERLKNKQITLIVSSPLKRAMQTAQIIAASINAPIFVDHRFMEVNMGIVEGWHISLVEKKFAELYQTWQQDLSGNTRFPQGESKQEVRRRILEGLNDYAQNSPHERIAVSTHGIVLSQMLQYLGVRRSNIPNGAILHLLYQPNAWKYFEFLA